MSSLSPLTERPFLCLHVLSLAVWITAAALLFLAQKYTALFDSSPAIVSGGSDDMELARSLLRWDMFFFASIATDGYAFEQQFAFMPGVPFLMRALRWVRSQFRGAHTSTLAMLRDCAACVLIIDPVSTLYQLSSEMTLSPSFGMLTSMLSLLPASPATSRLTPYTEPFFTCLSYRGKFADLYAPLLLIGIRYDVLQTSNVGCSDSVFYACWLLSLQWCSPRRVCFLGNDRRAMGFIRRTAACMPLLHYFYPG